MEVVRVCVVFFQPIGVVMSFTFFKTAWCSLSDVFFFSLCGVCVF